MTSFQCICFTRWVCKTLFIWDNTSCSRGWGGSRRVATEMGTFFPQVGKFWALIHSLRWPHTHDHSYIVQESSASELKGAGPQAVPANQTPSWCLPRGSYWPVGDDLACKIHIHGFPKGQPSGGTQTYRQKVSTLRSLWQRICYLPTTRQKGSKANTLSLVLGY